MLVTRSSRNTNITIKFILGTAVITCVKHEKATLSVLEKPCIQIWRQFQDMRKQPQSDERDLIVFSLNFRSAVSEWNSIWNLNNIRRWDCSFLMLLKYTLIRGYLVNLNLLENLKNVFCSVISANMELRNLVCKRHQNSNQIKYHNSFFYERGP